MSSFCQLWLTCADEAEAGKISQVLLEKHLIVCAKQVPVSSDFLWEGKVDHNDEVLLVMDSREDLFEEVESEIKELHNYETFVLESVLVNKVSGDASKWMQDNLKQGS